MYRVEAEPFARIEAGPKTAFCLRDAMDGQRRANAVVVHPEREHSDRRIIMKGDVVRLTIDARSA